MKTARIRLPFGRKSIKCALPSSRLLGCLGGKNFKIARIETLLSEAFGESAGMAVLEKVLKAKRRVLIVVPDATRHAYLKKILPRLLRRLNPEPGQITIIVATGLHLKHNKSQLIELLGSVIVKRCRVIGHGTGKGDVVDLGATRRGVPISLDRNLLNHDVVLSVGVIEPHLYAGYSGGAKTVAIGLAGEDTINSTHGVAFLDHPLVGIGSIRDNPFQQTLWEIAKKTALAFSVNVVNDSQGRALKIFCGNPEDVFSRGVELAKRVYEVTVSRPADIVICAVGYPKDVNLYQASRAINYVLNVDRPVLKKGGVLIVAAELRYGIGASDAEIRFYDTLRKMRSPNDLITSFSVKGCRAGEHRAYMVAGALREYRVVFVTGRENVFIKNLPFAHFETIDEAVRHATEVAGRSSSIYAIPHALSTIARAGVGCA